MYTFVNMCMLYPYLSSHHAITLLTAAVNTVIITHALTSSRHQAQPNTLSNCLPLNLYTDTKFNKYWPSQPSFCLSETH